MSVLLSHTNAHNAGKGQRAKNRRKTGWQTHPALLGSGGFYWSVKFSARLRRMC